jgi:hypothetical protein
MLRYVTLGLGGMVLAAGLLSADPAQAEGRRNGQWQRRSSVQWGQRYNRRPTYAWSNGSRANRRDLDRDGIPNYRDWDDDGDRIADRRDRHPLQYDRNRWSQPRNSYRRDFDRDRIPNYRDRDIDGDRVRNSRDRYDRNRFRR